METQELKQLFFSLFNSKNEDEVNCIIKVNPEVFRQENWHPFGENESFFGVIENQQASPVPALIEKITNSIDAILTRKCYEAGIEPTSVDAPKSMDEALEKFFPDSKQWDLPSFRKVQSESIQIIADGPRMDTSLIIYDDGEGQHPENFEKTFLSLLRGNKNEIHFVQGKYNMGGSGAIVFCGKKRYHLIA
ncbi:MAG TPA: ATP-binding protein, partial [Ignavibacteriaceae bacterium]|nr:ATP-binding protein [Ignavibacteriaceae bacterium]